MGPKLGEDSVEVTLKGTKVETALLRELLLASCNPGRLEGTGLAAWKGVGSE